MTLRLGKKWKRREKNITSVLHPNISNKTLQTNKQKIKLISTKSNKSTTSDPMTLRLGKEKRKKKKQAYFIHSIKSYKNSTPSSALHKTNWVISKRWFTHTVHDKHCSMFRRYWRKKAGLKETRRQKLKSQTAWHQEKLVTCCILTYSCLQVLCGFLLLFLGVGVGEGGAWKEISMSMPTAANRRFKYRSFVKHSPRILIK